jgi:hypothetical protein
MEKAEQSINCTTVINVGQLREQANCRDLHEWLEDPNNVYIGREGYMTVDGKRCRREGSIWGNPFKVRNESDRDARIASYKAYIVQRIKDENLYEELERLRDKCLGCWCVDCRKTYDPAERKVCHGQVLLELLANGVP